MTIYSKEGEGFAEFDSSLESKREEKTAPVVRFKSFEKPNGVCEIKEFNPDDGRPPELIWRQKDGNKTVEFNQYLPDGWRFEDDTKRTDYLREELGREKITQTGHFAALPKQRVVLFGDLSKKGSLLSLLHEIAHAYQFLGQEGQSFFGDLQSSQFFGNTTLRDPESILKFARELAVKERGAWAYALQRIKSLKKSGIELEPELDTLAVNKQYIHGCLQTHLDGFLEDAWPIFGRKFKIEKGKIIRTMKAEWPALEQQIISVFREKDYRFEPPKPK